MINQKIIFANKNIYIHIKQTVIQNYIQEEEEEDEKNTHSNNVNKFL